MKLPHLTYSATMGHFYLEYPDDRPTLMVGGDDARRMSADRGKTVTMGLCCHVSAICGYARVQRRWAQPNVVKYQYLDWMNNYLTVQGWANINGCSLGRARRMVKAGRLYQYGYATILTDYSTIVL